MGLKGNSGLMFDEEGNVTGHICAPYDATDDMVFVEVYEEDDPTPSWARMPQSEAKPKDIIACSRCAKAAAQMDHHWPYNSLMTLCSEHLEELKAKPRRRKRA